MKNYDQIIKSAHIILQTEADSILNLIQHTGIEFAKTVETVLNCEGRLVLTGVGKSAIIAQKIAATLNSTGTAALFMHAADAIHGDLGMVQQQDIVLALSKSGNTAEIKALVPLVKNMGNKLIAMTGNTESFLARQSDYVLNTTIQKEACPHNLAPTSSTTAQLAMGDALAVCLLECREFSDKDFAKYHPGGSLGKQLYLKCSDLADLNNKPQVNLQDEIGKVIIEISAGRLGAVAVTNQEKLAGIITDGDIRRMIQKGGIISENKISDIMGKNPKTIQKDELAIEARNKMKQFNISQLVVMNEDRFYGFIHLHDLMREGLV